MSDPETTYRLSPEEQHESDVVKTFIEDVVFMAGEDFMLEVDIGVFEKMDFPEAWKEHTRIADYHGKIGLQDIAILMSRKVKNDVKTINFESPLTYNPKAYRNLVPLIQDLGGPDVFTAEELDSVPIYIEQLEFYNALVAEEKAERDALYLREELVQDKPLSQRAASTDIQGKYEVYTMVDGRKFYKDTQSGRIMGEETFLTDNTDKRND